MMPDGGFLQVLATGAAGGIVALAGQWLLGRQRINHELHISEVERRRMALERRYSFELEHLLALRDLLTRVNRKITTMLAPGSEWQPAGDLAELRGEIGLAMPDDIRAQAERAYQALAAYHWTLEAGGPTVDTMRAAGVAVTETQVLISDRIRTMYSEESP